MWDLEAAISEKFNEYQRVARDIARNYMDICDPVERDIGSSFDETRWIYWRFNAARDVYRSAINKVERAITSDRNVTRRPKWLETLCRRGAAWSREPDVTDWYFFPDIIITASNTERF